MKYIGTGVTLSASEAWRSMASLIGHWSLRGYGFWAVEEKSSGKLIGRVGIWNPHGWPGIEVGWTLVKSSWGNGYATEAALAAIDWGFANINTDELISLIIPENAASIRVSERIGQSFKETGRMMDLDVNIYSIRKEKG